MRPLPRAAAVFAILLSTVPARAVLTPGDSTRPLPHAGQPGQYLLHVPASYDGTTAVPLVLDFHGFTSNAEQQKAISGMVAVSDREGFLVAHPSGLNNAWNAGLCCGNAGIDDVGFIRAVVADIAAAGNVDLRRVYATGLSNGGAISQRLACDAADLFAATAPMAFPVPADPLSGCQPVRPIPVLTFMGLNDALVRYDGNLFPSAPATFDYWHDVNGCPGVTPDVTVVEGDSRCERYTGCAQNAEAGLCSITAQTFNGSFFDGHILYLNDDFVLADVAWEFLSRFTLPEDAAFFRRATVAGTTRLKLHGGSTMTDETTWELGLGDGTWWATDAAGRPLAGAARGKGKRRKLVLSTDAIATLTIALAEARRRRRDADDRR
jgi:polyhydroxybutyrate depolymerase